LLAARKLKLATYFLVSIAVILRLYVGVPKPVECAKPARSVQKFVLADSIIFLRRDIMRDGNQPTQREIIEALGVRADCDAAKEAEARIAFLAGYLSGHGGRAYVLGISGGVDSTTAGRLTQLAVERRRAQGAHATFIAMRLPYGRQQDEADAQLALDFIRPDHIVTVDIKPAADALMAALEANLNNGDAAKTDFLLGNIKARQRMIAQFAVAGAHDGFVIGTDHAAEAVMGFFTKYGDGGFDLAPLAHLNKRQVRAVAASLGAPANLVGKQPTADLENLAPQKPDEVAFGIRYDEIDDFLEGLAVSDHASEVITTAYAKTMHKRMLPAEPCRS
jgi:NAD+ synthase